MRFSDRVGLITGGGRGIGAATAALFAREGARVAVSDMDLAPAEEVAGPLRGLAVACDGIIRDNLIFKMSDDDWDAVIDTHLKGTFLCARAAQKPMVERQ